MFGLIALGILVGTVGMSGYYRRLARVQSETIPRSREGGVLQALRAVGALALFGPILLYAVAPSWMEWASFSIPDSVRWAGVFLGLMTMPAASWVLRSLGRNVSETVLTKADHQLVMFGPYRWVRHPLYTTGLTLFLSLGLINGSWFVLSVVVVAAAFMRLVVIPAEERQLMAKFGDRYQRYMRTTGRFMPRIFSSSVVG